LACIIAPNGFLLFCTLTGDFVMTTIRLSRGHDALTLKRIPQRGHVAPRPPVIDLNYPGRLRTKHILALCGISHSTLYARLKAKTFPAPDGKDGGLIYWNTVTIKNYLGA
jgi:predicted DNA-binding transcriptional regulator AlpA